MDVSTTNQTLDTKHYSVVIAGSTERTRICASSIFADSRFKITGVLTPGPKPVGRKQIAEPNPMHVFATAHDRPLVVMDDKITDDVKETMGRVFEQPDILMVVDFGYIIPSWMLTWPKIAPVNVHPSHLPKYRGSSPGQYALVFGETQSAVTIMVMDEQLDHGPIIKQLPFSVEQTWKTPDYYSFAFDLVHDNLAGVLSNFIEKQLEPINQPDTSPTPVAKHLKREDGFVPIEVVKGMLFASPSSTLNSQLPTVPFLDRYSLPTSPSSLYNLWRGFYPWPGLWTEVEIKGEKKRLKLLEMHLDQNTISLDQVQIEGKLPQPWNEVAQLLTT